MILAKASEKREGGVPRRLLMARIGIHHRLLLRVEEGRLAIVDFITRENLSNGLKRLRAG